MKLLTCFPCFMKFTCFKHCVFIDKRFGYSSNLSEEYVGNATNVDGYFLTQSAVQEDRFNERILFGAPLNRYERIANTNQFESVPRN